ncbi:hypothetical protein B0H66DRAFT_571222 [Apodospora peruviana]|uniref:Uncharacterized protein n=1 Tax=Apodospora peruviana TaxID=516989 RepID=A0AAE0HS91_9PEZI|nr:hypothetical protein B0H66DRAFT_571222 [Apodospora peruviana]
MATPSITIEPVEPIHDFNNMASIPDILVTPALDNIPVTPAQPSPMSDITFEMEDISDMIGSESASDSDSDIESTWSEPAEAQSSDHSSSSQKVPITPDTPAFWPPHWKPAWPPEATARFNPAPKEPAPLPPPVEPFPTVLDMFNDFEITISTPCRFKFIIPLKLPPLIDQSMPAPPYYPPNCVKNHVEKSKRILRPVIAGALLELLGPDAPLSALVPEASRGNRFDSWLKNKVLAHIVPETSQFDLVTGHWKDQYGKEGNEILAYEDFGETIAVYYAYEFRVDQCIGEKDVNPVVIFFQAMPELRDGRAVFIVDMCDGDEQEYINMRIREREGFP